MSTEIAKSYFFKGLEYLEKEDFANAEQAFISTVSYAPRSVAALSNLAFVQFRQNKFAACIASSKRLIEIDANSFDAYDFLSSSYKELGHFSDALKFCDQCIALNATACGAYSNRAYLLNKLDRFEEAIQSSDLAISIDPNFTDAMCNRGNSLKSLRRYEEALAAYDRALSIKSDLEAAWLGRGNVFADLGRHDEALAGYGRALSIKPDLDGAWLGRGNVFTDLKRHDEAFAAYDKALSIKPDLEGAWLGRGNVLFDLKRHDEAFAAYDEALSLKPDFESAWLGRGNVLIDLKRYEEALAAYDRALSIKPDLESVEGLRLLAKLHSCNWENLAAEIANLSDSIRAGKVGSPPFALLALTDSPEEHLRCARTWFDYRSPKSAGASSAPARHNHARIRLGYVSADFRDHPVAQALCEVLERHDRSRFEVFGFSIGPNDNSAARARLVKGLDVFHDVHMHSDMQAAKLIRDSEIDILMYVAPFTEFFREGLVVQRPCPIQVNFFGAWTSGSALFDYLIADPLAISASERHYYAERIAYVRGFPSDTAQITPTKLPSRRDHGLPERAHVFCCFNKWYKLNPNIFDAWMNVLSRVDTSVLWLSDGGPRGIENLKARAAARGIDPSRLVFARHARSMDDHLARLALADLFLDTLPYGGHTTARDALWVGVPVLTQKGNTFAGRMGAIQLAAIGLPELIAHSREEYEALAIELALDSEKLRAIKEKLGRNRSTAPLFDTASYTRHLEAAYEAMYLRYRAGAPPDHIEVAAS